MQMHREMQKCPLLQKALCHSMLQKRAQPVWQGLMTSNHSPRSTVGQCPKLLHECLT